MASSVAMLEVRREGSQEADFTGFFKLSTLLALRNGSCLCFDEMAVYRSKEQHALLLLCGEGERQLELLAPWDELEDRLLSV